MKLKAILKIKTKGEAREIAIKWQKWVALQALSYGELAKYQEYFEILAKKFNLIKEFKENCII